MSACEDEIRKEELAVCGDTVRKSEMSVRKDAVGKSEMSLRKDIVEKSGRPVDRDTAGNESAPDDRILYDDVSRQMYEVFSGFARKHEQRAMAMSVSGEEGLLHFLAYRQDGVCSGFLKKQMAVGTGRMADILRRLEEKGMIRRGEDPKDCRKVIVHITEQGRDQALRTNERLIALYGKMRAYLGEKDSRELIRILKKLSEFQG